MSKEQTRLVGLLLKDRDETRAFLDEERRMARDAIFGCNAMAITLTGERNQAWIELEQAYRRVEDLESHVARAAGERDRRAAFLDGLVAHAGPIADGREETWRADPPWEWEEVEVGEWERWGTAAGFVYRQWWEIPAYGPMMAAARLRRFREVGA